MSDSRTRPYPTNLSDAEWAALEPLLPPPAGTGRPLKWRRHLMAEAIFYLVRSGCAWRLLPTSFPHGRRCSRTSAAGGSTAHSAVHMLGCAYWRAK